MTVPRTTDGDTPPWSLTVAVAGVALLLIAMMLIGLTSAAPISMRLASLVLLVPAGFFAMLAWGFAHSAITGRRPPGADRIDRFFGRLNRSL